MADAFRPNDIPRIRAFLARQFPQYEDIHNHTPDGGSRYIYPRLQFKMIGRQPVILGFATGEEILLDVFTKVGFIELNGRRIEVPEKSIVQTTEKLGPDEAFHKYKFHSPWMALNQANFAAYKEKDPIEKEQFLNRILWGNLRFLAHGVDLWIEDQEAVKVSGHFKFRPIQFKGNSFAGFTGTFTTNFCIPEFMGVGKQVARGFGAVIRGPSK